MIITLPQNILFHVLSKMPRVALTRMRRTCSYLNNLAGKREVSFEKIMNPSLDFNLIITSKFPDKIIYDDSPTRSFSSQVFDQEHERRVEGALLKYLDVSVYPEKDQFAIDKMISCLRRIRPRCLILSLQCRFAPRDMIRIADAVEGIDNYLEIQHRDEECDTAEKFFKAISQSKYRAKLSVWMHNDYKREDYYDGDLFEIIKHFRSCRLFRTDSKMASRLIQGIFNATDLGSLSFLYVNFYYPTMGARCTTPFLCWKSNPLLSEGSPPLEILLCDDFLKGSAKKRYRGNFCYLLKSTKYVIVFQSSMLRFHFVDTLGQVFDEFVKFHSLKNVKSGRRRKFEMAPSEKRRREIVVKSFTEHAKTLKTY